jgi:hypothetical protein
MKVRGLSPESYGTLRALRTRKKLRYFEEQVAAELIAAGFARRNEGLLVATSLTLAKPQTPERPTPKRVI